MRFSHIKRKQTKSTFIEPKIGPIMLPNMLRPIFDSTLEHFWHFWAIFVFQSMLKPLFYSIFSRHFHFLGHPKTLGTLFVTTTALTEEKCSFFFCILGFGVFAVSGFWSLFERNEKTKKKHSMQNNRKGTNPEDANKKPLNLVTHKESRQHRHTTIQLHCLDCKQHKKNQNKIIKH